MKIIIYEGNYMCGELKAVIASARSGGNAGMNDSTHLHVLQSEENRLFYNT